eukprot:scaffold20028_cov106-Isochrysis_galbana.AAC.2
MHRSDGAHALHGNSMPEQSPTCKRKPAATPRTRRDGVNGKGSVAPPRARPCSVESRRHRRQT